MIDTKDYMGDVFDFYTTSNENQTNLYPLSRLFHQYFNKPFQKYYTNTGRVEDIDVIMRLLAIGEFSSWVYIPDSQQQDLTKLQKMAELILVKQPSRTRKFQPVFKVNG